MLDTDSKLLFKNWKEEDKPREKFLLRGADSLTDAELLAIIIGSGTTEEAVIELAHRMLQYAGNNLNRLGQISPEQLITNFKGIGKAKAISILATMELGKRRKISELTFNPKIVSSKQIYSLVHPLFYNLQHEEFWILLLNRSNKVISQVKISQGGVSETTVDNRLIVREAINHLASGIILCHNHPSGNKVPSECDDQLTYSIQKGAFFFNIKILDHVIVCDGDYYSYTDEGRL